MRQSNNEIGEKLIKTKKIKFEAANRLHLTNFARLSLERLLVQEKLNNYILVSYLYITNTLAVMFPIMQRMTISPTKT